LDKAEVEKIREKISSLREVIAKSQAGEGVSASELKEKVDELQNASLNLFDQMYKSRSAEGQQQQGEQAAQEEPKPEDKKP